MRGINKVILIGRLGKDPEVKYLENGTPLAKFSVATSESYKDRSGNQVENTEWHNLIFWRKQAEIAEKYLRKGSLIYLEGKLQTRSWDDANGNKRYTTEIIGDFFQMLDKKSDNAGGNWGGSPDPTPPPESPASSSQEQPIANEGATDDLPF